MIEYVGCDVKQFIYDIMSECVWWSHCHMITDSATSNMLLTFRLSAFLPIPGVPRNHQWFTPKYVRTSGLL